MIILGIDPGYGRMGYAVLQKDKEEKLLEFSCAETDPKSKHVERVMVLAEKIEDLIKKYKPDYLAIERVFFTKNQKTALQVSEVKGMVTYIGLKNKLKVVEYTPLQVKSAVCGYGKATKDQVEKMIRMILKIKEQIEHDDTADAIALCLACSASEKHVYCGIHP